MSTATAVQAAPQKPGLIAKFADKFGVEPNKMLATLKATAFKGDVSNEQMMALLIVADQYGLNPWTKEIYAFPDKNNGIVPVVGVDGWARIINTHDEFDGMEFALGLAEDGKSVESVTCTIHRKDRAHPIVVTEYMAECKRDTGPWRSHPRRMLRHKAMIQCARLAFGYVGIYDEDEAERIIEGQARVVQDDPPAIAAINDKIAGKGTTIDATATKEAPAAQDAPAPGPTAAEIGDRIAKAKTADQVNEALALLHEGIDDKTRAELLSDADAKLQALGK